jgi:DNA-binding XRE family transcriptional regulator
MHRSKAATPASDEIATLLKKRRIRLRLEQGDIAAKIGVSSASISHWEMCQTVPSLAQAVAWCEALGLDLYPRELWT